MKALILNISIAILFVFTSCQKDEIENPAPSTGFEQTIIPTSFGVDIPSALIEEGNGSLKSASTKQDEGGDFSGNDIYKHLRNFIALGQNSAQLVKEILQSIATHNINGAMSLTYTSDEDGRQKHLEVIEGAQYLGLSFEYKLVITDVDSEGNEDGGRAIVILWNKMPLHTIAILKPYNINRVENENAPMAVYKINYSEVGTAKYDRFMTVTIAHLPMPSEDVEPYAVNRLKMFVGIKGDYVDVFGNTNHPNARFFTEKKGFNWSFVASATANGEAGVAEVGLPPVELNAADRNTILVDYSIKRVITDEVNRWFITEFGVRPDQSDLAKHLKDADAPGYFNRNGFVQSGTAPNELGENLKKRIQNLSPYNPSDINQLEVVLE